MAPEILSPRPLSIDPAMDIVSKSLSHIAGGGHGSKTLLGLAPLFQENTLAKVLRTGSTYLENNNPPTRFPETVPQTGSSYGKYQCRDAEFWTCGFFPGSLYCLLERFRKYPGSSISTIAVGTALPNDFHTKLLSYVTNLCCKWSEPLFSMASRKDTHDLGFIVQPALQRDWELFGRQKSLDALLSAADSLASRYDDRVGAIRSWNRFSNAHHDIENMEEDFIVIIDSLCNLDLLFYAANYTRSTRLLSIGKTHATTLLTTHLRKESVPNRETCYSTYHAVNFCPANKGHLKRKFTAQGYSDNSTWARGQAWAILGYAQTFSWTKQEVFLQTAMGLADYFIYRMELSPKVIEASGHGRYVPLWDFDAPITFTTVKGIQTPLRDVSAGLIAANGMIILYGQLLSLGRPECARRYLEYALAIANDTIALAYNREQVCLSFDKKSETIRVVSSGESEGRLFDSILERSTANFNEDHADRHWDHGLVYADYYFLELGNRLLDMGLAL